MEIWVKPKHAHIYELPVIFMTHLKLTTILLLTLIFSSTKAQNSSEMLDTIVKEFVQQLADKKIDTVCVYQKYCVGYITTWKNEEDKCNAGGLLVSTYIVWLDKGQTFMTKKDNCFDYSTIQFTNEAFWNFYFTNQDTIAKEEIKMPQYIEIVKGKEQTYYSSIDHSCHQEIKVFTKTLQIDKDLDEYNFEKEIGSAKNKNINYDYNINSFLKKFQTQIEQTITNETKLNRLIKTRR